MVYLVVNKVLQFPETKKGVAGELCCQQARDVSI